MHNAAPTHVSRARKFFVSVNHIPTGMAILILNRLAISEKRNRKVAASTSPKSSRLLPPRRQPG